MLAMTVRRIDIDTERLSRESGQALVEYALILGLVCVVAIAVLSAVSANITSIFQAVTAALNSAL
jgi:Flp pilus assembly pilin Flp